MEQFQDKKLIYIADDEYSIREALKAFLESADFDVVPFETGDDLYTAFQEKPADLVILDVMMPGSSGFIICKALREQSDIPIITLTARDSDLDYKIAMDYGSTDYFTKPESPMNIVSRVKSIFRHMEYQREAEIKDASDNHETT